MDKNNAKANGQALRDKLNQTLKQRLGKKTDAAKTLAERELAANEKAPPTPSVDDRGKALSRDRQFLDELESDARHEVGLIDHIGMFASPSLVIPSRPTPTAPLAPKEPPLAPPLKTNQWPPQSSGDLSAELSSTPPASYRPLQAPAPPHRPLDAEGLFDMPEHDDNKNFDAPPSLMDMLRTSKPESRTGSSLKPPRQSTQNAALAPSPEPDVEPDADADTSSDIDSDASGSLAKNSFLKAPRNKSQNHAAPAPAARHETVQEPHLEQEIADAIKRGDKAWIAQNANFANISPGRQEILLVFAFSKPECILALLSAGLKFEPKDGLAIRTALSRKDYGALEALKARGADIDLDTLKAIAAWRRNINKDSAKPGKTDDRQEPALSPDGIQADFDDFLRAHSSEIQRDDLDVFSAPTPKPEMATNHSTTRSEPPFAPSQLSSTDNPDTGSGRPIAVEPTIETNDLSFRDAFEEMQQTLHLHGTPPLTSDKAPDKAPDGPTPTSSPDSSLDLVRTATSHEAHHSSLPAADSSTFDEIPVHETTNLSAPDVVAEPHLPPENPNMTQLLASDARKAHAGSPGISAMDRARLSMLDKVLLEKQQLEMKVIELQMFEEATASLEDERDRLLDELSSSQDDNARLTAELARSRQDFTAFGGVKSQLESELSEQKKLLTEQAQSSRQEQDRLAQAEANLSSLLKDHERSETELRSHNAQLAVKISELENRVAPAPEATDWLKGTEKEATLRKNMFIDTVIKGEHKLLDKVSKNTAVDIETAHWALVFAAETGQIRCAQWLVDHLDAHPGFGGELALLRALDSKNHDMVRWLATHGGDIHHAEEFALRKAIDLDDVPLLDLLVSMGANPRVARERPLREAADKHSWGCFKALLGYGCTGSDDKGVIHPELAEQTEGARPHMEWAIQQRKLSRALDPDFSKRQLRRDH